MHGLNNLWSMEKNEYSYFLPYQSIIAVADTTIKQRMGSCVLELLNVMVVHQAKALSDIILIELLSCYSGFVFYQQWRRALP